MNKGLKAFLIILIFVIVAGAGIYLAKSKNENKTEENKQTAQTDQGQVAGTDSTSNGGSINPNTDDNDQDSQTSNVTAKDTDIILFYGETCPHCKKVEKFISENKIDQILKFQNLEVYKNKDNLTLMKEKQKVCKDLAEEDKGGVPFLYSSEKCIVGDQPIIDFFKEKAGV